MIFETLLNSLLLVFVGEMGDKTQLLSLILVARYRQPWVILAGVGVATLLNHFLAAGLGGFLSSLVEPHILKWLLAGLFVVFAFWLLIPDKEDEVKTTGQYGVFLTTVVVFFLAEMGDKTQLATVALGARYQNLWLVTLGTTLGMLASNALAIFLGEKLLKTIPMKWIRIFAALLFLGFAILIVYNPVY